MLPKMKEILPNPLTNPGKGLFSILRKKGEKLSFLSEQDALTLDGDYYFFHSGEKRSSPTIGILIDYQETHHDDFDWMDYVAEMIYLRFADNWQRIYQAYNAEYQPLENYSMTENENTSGEDSRNDDGITKSSTKITSSNNSDAGSYGFNNNDSVPTDTAHAESVTQGDGDDNKEERSASSNGSRSEARELTRHGNIGVTTSQQMLQSELDLRKYDLFAMLMADVDKICTLSIY